MSKGKEPIRLESNSLKLALCSTNSLFLWLLRSSPRLTANVYRLIDAEVIGNFSHGPFFFLIFVIWLLLSYTVIPIVVVLQQRTLLFNSINAISQEILFSTMHRGISLFTPIKWCNGNTWGWAFAHFCRPRYEFETNCWICYNCLHSNIWCQLIFMSQFYVNLM